MIILESANPPIAIWFVGLGDKLDFMGCLKRASAQSPEFHFDYRFRYHRDDKVFDSEDEKHWYHMSARDKTEDEILAITRDLVLQVCAKDKEFGNNPQLSEMLYRNYNDFAHFMREFQNQPWAYSKIASPEDEEKYGLPPLKGVK